MEGRPADGYRIYEVNVDGPGLRQLTFPAAGRSGTGARSTACFDHYHHGTDDMQPCYLPDGGIAFISTRCQYGILCDGPDDFTTTVLYRMDADGKNLCKLSNSSVSEASPVMLPDGRIMYTRWEYVDKGAVSVKCLWAMRPDGTASAEIYGNDIALPPTFIYGRPIPGAANQYVVCGTPHCPQNGVGTVIRLDMNKNIRTREPMTYMTPDVDIRAEGGFRFPPGRRHVAVTTAGTGRCSRTLIRCRRTCSSWRTSRKGPRGTTPRPTAFICWTTRAASSPFTAIRRFPVGCRIRCGRGRCRPCCNPTVNAELARGKQAVCVVARRVSRLEGRAARHDQVHPRAGAGSASLGRPPALGGDEYDQQHACITKDTHLGLKVQHGIVPVEADGSACFVVPAEANIFLPGARRELHGGADGADVRELHARRDARLRRLPRDAEPRRSLGRRRNAAGHAPAAFHARPPARRAERPPAARLRGRRAAGVGRPLPPVSRRRRNREGRIWTSAARSPRLFNVSYESLVPERRKARTRPPTAGTGDRREPSQDRQCGLPACPFARLARQRVGGHAQPGRRATGRPGAGRSGPSDWPRSTRRSS